jgi:iron complex transport system ATP-binding protein
MTASMGSFRFRVHPCSSVATIERMSADVPILELADATVVKDGRPVLDRLTLRIGEGEHTAIIGPNGAGKSILLSLLTLEQRPIAPANGTPPVRVFGQQNWDLFELRSQLGIISADLHQHFVNGNSEGSITAEAAVVSAFLSSYGILRYGTVTDGMRQRAASALDAAGASQLAGRTLDEMSSGEARRVLLARALVTSPRALVLDEPTTGLDLVARHAFMETVRHLARKGTTVVLITHHIEEIFPEIQRVILLRDGRIFADGNAAANLTAARLTELFDYPVAVDVADGYHYARPTEAPARA